MITNLYSVFDAKTANFGNPFPDMNDKSATRNFTDAVNDASNPANLWHKHPEDFSLYSVGAFDGDTGELIPNHAKAIITGSAVFGSFIDIGQKLDKTLNGKQLDLGLK